MDLLHKAIAFATEAHRRQKRKYTGEPYINHCLEVVEILEQHGIIDEGVLCAAVLHDTVEDTNVTFQQIKDEFGDDVMRLVFFVTDVVNDGDRDTKIILNSLHILNTPYRGSLFIKCADIISNTSTIMDRDVEFAAYYLREKEILLERMKQNFPSMAHNMLWKKACDTVRGK